jgi:hypothetical protein
MKRHFFLLALLLLAFFLTPGYGQSFKSPRHYYLFQSGELKKIHQDPLSLAPQPDQWKFWFYTVGTNAVPNEQYWREIAKPTLPQLIAAIKAIQQSEWGATLLPLWGTHLFQLFGTDRGLFQRERRFGKVDGQNDEARLGHSSR